MIGGREKRSIREKRSQAKEDWESMGSFTCSTLGVRLWRVSHLLHHGGAAVEDVGTGEAEAFLEQQQRVVEPLKEPDHGEVAFQPPPRHLPGGRQSARNGEGAAEEGGREGNPSKTLERGGWCRDRDQGS